MYLTACTWPLRAEQRLGAPQLSPSSCAIYHCVLVRVNVSATGCTVDNTTYNRVHVHFTQKFFIRTRHGDVGCCVCPLAAFACDNRVGLGTGHKGCVQVCVDGSRSWTSDCLRKLQARQFRDIQVILTLPRRICEASSQRAKPPEALIACGTE